MLKMKKIKIWIMTDETNVFKYNTYYRSGREWKGVQGEWRSFSLSHFSIIKSRTLLATWNSRVVFFSCMWNNDDILFVRALHTMRFIFSTWTLVESKIIFLVAHEKCAHISFYFEEETIITVWQNQRWRWFCR